MAVFAMSQSSTKPNLAKSAPKVFPLRNRIKMIWVYARSITTKVVELVPVGDFTNEKFVCDAVSAELITTRTESSDTVTGIIDA